MEKTFKELQDIDLLVGGLYAHDPSVRNTKFGYAYKRFSDKNYVPLLTELKEKIYDLRLANALEDRITKEILIDKTNERGFKFDKESLKKVIEGERVLNKEWEAKTVEITPFISSHVPEGLSDEEKEILKGIVLE